MYEAINTLGLVSIYEGSDNTKIRFFETNNVGIFSAGAQSTVLYKISGFLSKRNFYLRFLKL